MEYQKIRKFLDNTSNEPSKFRTRNWVEINDESRGTYTGNSIKFKTTMIRSNLCDYADAYIIVRGTITITGAGDAAAARLADERNKGVTDSESFKYEVKITGKSPNNGNTKDVEIIVPLKHLSNF